MNALFYLVRKSMKNSLRELRKKPGKLILYLLMIAGFASVMISSFFTKARADESVPLFWFTGGLFLFVALFVFIAIAKGLSSGDAIFEMNDVNFLFVSPLGTRKILLYGIFRMVKTAFAASFFILFQAGSLANLGIDYGGVLLTFAGFLLSVTVLTAVSLVIYCATNGRSGRKRLVKGIAVLLFLPLAVFAVMQYFRAPALAAAVEAAVESPFLRFIPVAGWTAGGVNAFLSGDIGAGLLFFAFNLLLCAGAVGCVMLGNPDYYEDVLVATETAYEKKRAVAEGNIEAASSSGTKAVKVTGTGISGSGAAALFGKHIRENLRQNKLGLFTWFSLVTLAGAVLYSMLTEELFLTLSTLMWMQIFMIGTGRGLKETFSHYIYLIPESSFRKILWSNMETVARVLLESILIFGISGLLLHAGTVYILILIAVYTLFSFLLLGINYVSMRFLGADLSAGLMLMFYGLAVVAAMLPGVAAALVIGNTIGGDAGLYAGLLLLAGWELAAGLGAFALSRGVLHSCDMAMMKKSR